MGQFLTIGLVTSYIISKQRANQQASATPEAVKDVMQKRYNQSGIYNLKENEHCVYLELKPEVAEAEMIDFLNDFYALRYPDEKRRNIMADMKVIGSMTTFEEWMKLAEKKEYQAFQFDDYVNYYTPFPGGWRDELDTSVEQIILSLDGKILMECYGELFGFFTKLIRERLSKYKLADGLLVYISG